MAALSLWSRMFSRWEKRAQKRVQKKRPSSGTRASGGRQATVFPQRRGSITYSQVRKWIIVKGKVAEEARRLGVDVSSHFLIELNERVYKLILVGAEKAKAAGRKRLQKDDLE